MSETRICPNEECSYRRKFGRPAEYRAGFERCSDCKSELVAAESVAPVREVRAPEPRPQVSAELVTRLLVTLLGPLVVVAMWLVPLPGVLHDLLPGGFSQARLGAIGLSPFITAFVLVELGAALIPSWNRLRVSGPGGRRKLGRFTAWLGLLFAAVQAFALARFFHSMSLMENPGVGATALFVLTLTTASAVLVLVASMISRQGLTNGFVVLLVSELLLEFVQSAAPLADVSVALPAGDLLLQAMCMGAVIVGAVLLLRRPANWDGAPLRGPVSGLRPATVTAPLVMFVLGQGAAVGLPGWDEPPAVWMLGIVAMVTIPGTVVLAILQNAPKRVADVIIRAGGGGKSEAQTALEIRARLPQAIAFSVVFCAALLVLPTLFEVPLLLAPALGVLVAAAGMDLACEWQARSRLGKLTSIWPLHQVYAIGPVCAALERESIEVHVRGDHSRACDPFFAPWVPAEIYVRIEDADRARALLERIAGEAA